MELTSRDVENAFFKGNSGAFCLSARRFGARCFLLKVSLSASGHLRKEREDDKDSEDDDSDEDEDDDDDEDDGDEESDED